MRGDFTRLTFDATKHYSRVLMQQGRVQLDSDWNEMIELQLHFLRSLAADLIGPHGGPGASFQIAAAVKEGKLQDLVVGPGHYYVDGILCENEARVGVDGKPLVVSYFQQPYLALDREKHKLPDLPFLVYLHVWERHVTHIEEEDESRAGGIREVGLRGPDTTTRTQIVWQLGGLPLTAQEVLLANNAGKRAALAEEKLSALRALSRSSMLARTQPKNGDDNPCLFSPESRYRGPENQLYRVEIHKGGPAWDGVRDGEDRPSGNKDDAATFKWSRENGSVFFPIRDVDGDIVTLEHLGRDGRFGLKADDWVEIVDDDYTLRRRSEPLLQIKEIDTENLRVTLKTSPAVDVGQDEIRHPYLRRWDSGKGDSQGGALLLSEGPANDDSSWQTLEDGVQILFPAGGNGASSYRSGDYWLVPARVATGDVEWPGAPSDPIPLPPHGVRHHYAPLAIVYTGTQGPEVEDSLRRKWEYLAK